MPFPVSADCFSDPPGVRFEHDDSLARNADHFIQAQRGAREVVQTILYDDEIVGEIPQIHVLCIEQAGFETFISVPTDIECVLREIGIGDIGEAIIGEESGFTPDAATNQ